MSNNKFKIGEFSRLGRVTVRTLRHYDQIGLLKPGIIDRWTGYRYYTPEQLQSLLSIVRLKELGFSLAEIADLFEEESHSPELKRLERKIGECELQIESLQRRLARLKALVDEKKRRTKMEKFYLDKLPEIVVAYNRVVLSSYDQLGMHLISVVAPEMEGWDAVAQSPATVLP